MSDGGGAPERASEPPAITNAGTSPAVANAGNGPAVANAGNGPAVANAGNGPAVANAGNGPAIAVTFDFGQTLVDLDPSMLSRRLVERGVRVSPESIDLASPVAWGAYDDAVRSGVGRPWQVFMTTLLAKAGATADIDALVDWLWAEQPKRNLWRRPVPDMIALVRTLRAAGVPVAVVSNSEGRLAELVAELGWTDLFPIIADSGVLGVEKPDPALFAWAADRLGVPLAACVHVGDAFGADVLGALGAGMRAIWYGGDPARALPPRAALARDAAEVAEALLRFGVGLHQ